MSDLWLNIRFGVWHLQCKKNSLRFYLTKNSYHAGKPFRIEVFEIKFPFGW